jgi:exopolyphosphatase/guanosine-5'-triphosphate,3'-diphosphate pyrophosphatase
MIEAEAERMIEAEAERMIEGSTMRVAALDLGTNTFLLLVADVNNGKIETVLHDEARVVRLGQGVHQSRSFHPEALSRAEACFSDYAQVIRKLGAQRTLACATSAARDVVNGKRLIELGDQHGIPIEIISGEQEAEYTFAGTLPAAFLDPVLVIDVGGGSTEFIYGEQGQIVARKSVDVGSVRLTELFVKTHPISAQELAAMSSYLEDKLSDLKKTFPVNPAARLIAVAGTPTTFAAIDQERAFEPGKVDGYRMDYSRLEAWVQKLAGMDLSQRASLPGMDPKRADVIVAGGMTLLRAAEQFQCVARQLEVSIRGLRYGVALRVGGQK